MCFGFSTSSLLIQGRGGFISYSILTKIVDVVISINYNLFFIDIHNRTNQHSCADPNNHCDMILQYMCGDNVRNGITTQ